MRSLLGALGTESETGGPFDLINGIPVHPLVVHAAVVMVPLTALGVVVMAAVPRFSRRYGWLVVIASLVGTGASFVSKQAGEALAERVGQPGFDHAELGDIMPIVAALLMAVTVALWLIDRSAPDDGPNPRRGLRIGVAVIAVLVAVGNAFWMYRVGDSGAKSVWAGKVAVSQTASGAGASASPSSSASPTSSPATYTLSEVAAHSTPGDCWSAINGKVYDLTRWIDQHPGGPQQIIDLCGTDGSAGFDAQHGGQARPEQELAQFLVGSVG
jgi:predicted heme/steroid binding protein